MKKRYFISILLILGLALKSYGQNDTIANTFSMDLDFLFYLSHKQMDQYPDLKFVNTAHLSYLEHFTESNLFFRQVLDRSDDGSLSSNHYINLSTSLYKHKPVPPKRGYVRVLRPEGVFIFQNNSGRGLQKRFQTGLFFYPLRTLGSKINVNLGLGCLYDWSSWEVNDMEKINDAPPKLQEKILFVNSHSKLRNNMYFDFSEWRPSLFLTFKYQPNEILALSFWTYYQQSLVSPFNEVVKSAYPELRKVYPYTHSNLSASVKVYKGFSLKYSFILDYENNNISIYDSSWEYQMLFGITWNLTHITPRSPSE
jgi:hypothetical protein